MSRLKRFMHLERPRRGEAGRGAPATGAPTRFDALEERQAPPTAPAETGAGRRFEAPAPPEALELAPASPGEQPFVRCCRCEADAGRYEAACPRCGAALHTEEQRFFNLRLWEARQAEAAAERAAAREGAAPISREAAEELARDARRELEERLAQDGWAGTPLLCRWLDRIGDPRRRRAALAGVIAGVIAVFVGSLYFGRPAVFAVALLVFAFVLRRPGRRPP